MNRKNTTEYTIRGIRPGENMETLLFDKIEGGQFINDKSIAEKIKTYCIKKLGCKHVRIAEYDSFVFIDDFLNSIN